MTRTQSNNRTQFRTMLDLVKRKETMTRETRNGFIAGFALVALTVALVTDLHRIVLAWIYPYALDIYKFLFWN